MRKKLSQVARVSRMTRAAAALVDGADAPAARCEASRPRSPAEGAADRRAARAALRGGMRALRARASARRGSGEGGASWPRGRGPVPSDGRAATRGATWHDRPSSPCYAPPAMTSFVVNGQPRQVDEQSHDRLIDALRAGLRLTGAKESCSSGACGACTVLADGVAVLSCLLPTTAAAGRTIETVEGLGPGASSRPARADGARRPAVRLLHAGRGHAGRGVLSPLAGRARHSGSNAPGRQRRDGRSSVPLRRLRGHRRRHHTRLRGRLRRRRRSAVTASRRQVQGHRRGEVHGGRVPGRRAGRRHPPVCSRARPGPRGSTPGARSGRPACARRFRCSARAEDPGRFDTWDRRSLPSLRRPRQAARDALRLIDVEYEVLPAAIGMDGARAEGAPSVYRLGGPRSPSESELPLVPWPVSPQPARAVLLLLAPPVPRRGGA